MKNLVTKMFFIVGVIFTTVLYAQESNRGGVMRIGLVDQCS
jgi:hypothetical protein